MNKILLKPSTYLYPQPVVLIGANVNDVPSFTTVAWAGIANGNPPMISVALRHSRYILKGIKKDMVFSVNIPSTDMVKETDYCGIVSGANVNKAKVCGFKIFYGELDGAPLIEQCPVNLECEVVHTLDLGSHLLVIGRIRQAHFSESCLVDGKPSIDKIKPIVYVTGRGGRYHNVGEFLANAFSIGKDLSRGNG